MTVIKSAVSRTLVGLAFVAVGEAAAWAYEKIKSWMGVADDASDASAAYATESAALKENIQLVATSSDDAKEATAKLSEEYKQAEDNAKAYKSALDEMTKTAKDINDEEELRGKSDKEKLGIYAQRIAAIDEEIKKQRELFLSSSYGSKELADSAQQLNALARERHSLIKEGRSIQEGITKNDADAEKAKTELASKRSEFEITSKIKALELNGQTVKSKSLSIQKDINGMMSQYGYSAKEALDIWRAINKEKDKGKVEYSEEDKKKAQDTLDAIKAGKLGTSKQTRQEAEAIVSGKSIEGGFKSVRFKGTKATKDEQADIGAAYNDAYKSMTSPTAKADKYKVSDLSISSATTQVAKSVDASAATTSPAPQSKSDSGLAAKFEALTKEFAAFRQSFAQAFAQ